LLPALNERLEQIDRDRKYAQELSDELYAQELSDELYAREIDAQERLGEHHF
jgi:hypothetical protein